jgi:nucleotide-binding universal stress UspA family protein
VENRQQADYPRPERGGFEEFGGEFASEGLLLSEGEQWRRQRIAIQNAFTPDRIREYTDAMVGAAEEMVDPTLILMGSRGLSRLRRLLIGSVSEEVVARSNANVLLVPPSRIA